MLRVILSRRCPSSPGRTHGQGANRLYGKQGGFQAQNLAWLCERAYPFPTTELQVSRKQLLADLQVFISEKRLEVHWKNTIAGGKYPHLCAMGEELIEMLGEDLREIHIDRPLEESIESMKRRPAKENGWLGFSESEAETV